ncbi:MAG: hypothetical protein IKZ44_10890 [Clostridia bacterium]|nr:hypothetical protein [Clostridia bacterium]
MKKPADSSVQPVDLVRAKRKKTITAVICLLSIVAYFVVFAIPMGVGESLNTLMNTAYHVLMNTVFYLMAIAVIAGAISELLSEFGVVELINKILSPLMKPLFGMPGASALGIVTTYLSDNPAILTLANDTKFRRFFKAYQVPALTNLGTAFGMGLIVTSSMLALSGKLGTGVAWAALCGNLATVIGAIVSTRLMLFFMKRAFTDHEAPAVIESEKEETVEEGEKPKGFLRVLSALMDGGKKGVDLGLAIIPGVLIICSFVMMLTYGMPEGGYTGAAKEGLGVLPWIADKIGFLLKPLFGFSNNQALAIPVTALGSAGAALTMIVQLVEDGAVNLNDIAVFTAICMCWSGYLSTHVSMMDTLKCNRFTGKAILCHTIGGLCAGVAAHWMFMLINVIFHLQ